MARLVSEAPIQMGSSDSGKNDIPSTGWVASLPAAWQPYARLARLDRPIGTWLLLFPCWWGLALARTEHWWFYPLFGFGAVVMRGAGCTINDILDRDFDGRVERTASRPLPSGQVSLFQAILFTGAQLLLGLAVLLCLNWSAILLGFAIMGVVVTYPLMKRVTWWPQFFLGLAFNWGIPVGWAAAGGHWDWAPVLFYLAGICWTLGYDTIYAHQDKADDVQIGVRSTALRFGAASRAWIGGFYGASALLMLGAVMIAGFQWPACLGILLALCHMLWQATRTDFDDAAACLAAFKSNRWVGWLVLAGLLAG